MVSGSYSNLANPLAHMKSTGHEIWRQTEGELTHFVATMGTGGTISGCGNSLIIQAKKDGKSPPKIVNDDAKGSILKEFLKVEQ